MRWNHWSGIWSDLGVAVRVLTRRSRDTYLVGLAVVVLAFGLAAASATSTYLRAFDRPFPGIEDDGLVRLFRTAPDDPHLDYSYPDFLDLAAEVPGLAAAVQPFYAASVRLGDWADVAFIDAVSGAYFDVLGIETVLGRGLAPEDDRAGGAAVAVLAHSWWQRQWQGDTGVLGETLYLNGRPFTIVGVAAPEYLGLDSGRRPSVFIPIAPFSDRYTRWGESSRQREVELVRVFARLAEGGAEELAVRLAVLDRGLDEAYPLPDGRIRRSLVERATWIDPRDRSEEARLNRALQLAVGGFLLLVCANSANLLLARFERRRRELALRAALGAEPGRLVRTLLLESATIGLVAGLVGVAAAGPLARRLGSYFERPSVWGEAVPREILTDPRIALGALVLALVTGVLAGLPAALRTLEIDLVKGLGTRSSAEGPPSRLAGFRLPGWRSVLVGTQVAMSVLLLCLAGLVVRTLQVVRDLDTGFDHEKLVMSHVSTSSTDLAPEERDAFFRGLVARLGEENWVDRAAFSQLPPLQRHRTRAFEIVGFDEPVEVATSLVQAGVFETLGLRLVEGRVFDDRDLPQSPSVVVVDETMAARFLGGTRAVGSTLRWIGDDGGDSSAEVIGVVSSSRLTSLTDDMEPMVFFPYRQGTYGSGAALLVRTSGAPGAHVAGLERWLRDFESRLAIVNVVAYPEIVRGLSFEQRRNVELFTGLAFLGLVLSALVIFGVVTLSGSTRRREIGVRRALGARREDVRRWLVGKAMAPIVAGLVLGLLGAWAGAEVVRGLLYEVEPLDPGALAGAALAMFAVGLLAAYLPARTASRQDPVEALGAE